MISSMAGLGSSMKRRALVPAGLLLLWVIGAGCASSAGSSSRIPAAQSPPVPPKLQPLDDSNASFAVFVTSTVQVADFRVVFERSLGRAGFRVLRAGETSTSSTLTIALIGDGTGTSGSIQKVSYVKQFNKVDATISIEGRLRSEMRTQSAYSLVASENEPFDAYNRRVAEAASDAYEYMAVDLTNQLV